MNNNNNNNNSLPYPWPARITLQTINGRLIVTEAAPETERNPEGEEEAFFEHEPDEEEREIAREFFNHLSQILDAHESGSGQYRMFTREELDESHRRSAAEHARFFGEQAERMETAAANENVSNEQEEEDDAEEAAANESVSNEQEEEDDTEEVAAGEEENEQEEEEENESDSISVYSCSNQNCFSFGMEATPCYDCGEDACSYYLGRRVNAQRMEEYVGLMNEQAEAERESDDDYE